ncbi:MAG: arylsulfatase A-like enzyme [Myxococcota bacterium]
MVLIVIDTLRADRLGVYGADRETSPGIDALAASGVRFDDAYSTAPWTIPSITSILTGLYPSQHGVLTAKLKLTPTLTTLPEVFSAQGYQTAAVFSHSLIDENRVFAQGYSDFQKELGVGKTINDRISSRAVTDAAVAQLRSFSPDRPFFLFVHYFDPHYDYQNHDEWDFAADRAGRLDGDEGIWKIRAAVMSPPSNGQSV